MDTIMIMIKMKFKNIIRVRGRILLRVRVI